MPYKKITSEDKLALMFYVVYRYRNNIFHENKGIMSWTQDTEQIEKCISFMIIIDCANKYKMM